MFEALHTRAFSIGGGCAMLGLTLLLAACGTDNAPPAKADLVTLEAQSEPTTASLVEQSLAPGNPSEATALPVPQETVFEVAGVELPPGFSLIKYADFFRPTALAFDHGGRLLATSSSETRIRSRSSVVGE